MGEVFELRKPAEALPFTGERLTTSAAPQVEVEHLHRYFLARELCRGKDVLDVASGEGYGAALLAQVARSVVGVELVPEVVCHATKSYPAPNLWFLAGDARDLPFTAGAVDVVVSFETIEHMVEQDRFLAEVRRVLRPGGLLIVSTPDRDTYSPSDAPANPYHRRELSKAEFIDLLRGSFDHVACLNQRPMMGSAMLLEGEASGSAYTFERRGPDFAEANTGLPRAVYVIALASDRPVAPPSVSFHIETTNFGLILHRLAEAERRAAEAEAARTRAAEAEAAAMARRLTAERHAADAEAAMANATALRAIAEIERDAAMARRAEAERRSAEAEAARARASELRAAAEIERDAAVARSAEAERRTAEVEAASARAAGLRAAAEDQRDAAMARCAEAERRAVAIETATFWRATYPLRRMTTGLPRGLRRAARGGAKLVWWSLTLRLPGKLRQRSARLRAYRAALSPPPPTSAAPAAPPGGPSAAPQREASPGGPGADAQPWASLGGPDADPHPEAAASPEAESKLGFRIRLERDLDDFLKQGGRLTFPTAESPDISVLVVCYNQAHFTLACLRALLEQQGVRLEMVLVDNASTDPTPALLARLDNVQVLVNRENVGFSKAVNQAAKAASGRILLLLNNDAFVRPGTLGAALETLESDASIGAVGGRLVLPSGQLQEAGSIVWSDGSTIGYGRGLPAEAGEAMFRRDVDYCSGAFLLTPRTVFAALGGLDEEYSPAYHEDNDYCLRIRKAGKRVVYEPRAVIDHYEGASETGTGETVALCVRNQKTLRQRHGLFLAGDYFPYSLRNLLFARQRPRDCRRLLVLDDETPPQMNGSGQPRMRAILNEAVAAGWFASFYPLQEPNVDWSGVYEELRPEIEICAGFGVAGLAGFLRDRQGYYDTVLISRPHNMAEFRRAVANQEYVSFGSRLIYDAEALFALRSIAQSKLEGSPLSADEADTLVHDEIALTEGADIVVVTTPAEEVIFRSRTALPTCVIGTTVRPTPSPPPFEARTGFLFIGRLLATAAPNYSGLAWFIRSVWPGIRERLGNVDLTVIGPLHPDPVELRAPGVHLCGVVPDLAPFYQRARVFVSPTRFAAGLSIKVVEAMAEGLPVVTTRLIARQGGWSPDAELVVGDDPVEMVAAAVRIYTDPLLWETVRGSARRRVLDEYGEAAFAAKVRALLQGEVASRADCGQTFSTLRVEGTAVTRKDLIDHYA